MPAKAHNSTSAIIKDYIFTALMMLMEQKEYHDITISELTKKAGVSRMSYYRTYSSKEDILVEYFKDMFGECLEEIKQMPAIDENALHYKLFCMFHKNHQFIRNVMKAGLYKLMLSSFIEYTKYAAAKFCHTDTTDPYIDYKIHSEAGSLFMLVARWFETGLRQSPEEMTAIAANIPKCTGSTGEL